MLDEGILPTQPSAVYSTLERISQKKKNWKKRRWALIYIYNDTLIFSLLDLLYLYTYILCNTSSIVVIT